jgi:glycerol-3-phosphate acyltransferase PlsY
MAVVGHNWSIFLGWGGGAGTGPNVGWAAALWLPMLPIAFLVMVGLLLGLGMASVASLAMAAVIPTVFTVRYIAGLDPTPAYMIGGFAAAVVVIWALRPNIKRLLNGSERVVGPRAKRMKNAEG